MIWKTDANTISENAGWQVPCELLYVVNVQDLGLFKIMFQHTYRQGMMFKRADLRQCAFDLH